MAAQAHYRFGFNLVTGGYEFERENYANDNTDLSDQATASGTNVTQLSQAVFVQDQAQFLDGHLQISGSFRAQLFALEAPVFNPLASAPYKP